MNKKLLIIFLIFSIFQIPSLFSVSPSDEYIYYYMGEVVANGLKPYTDFFYGHPPLQIYLYAGIIKLFGVHVWLLKLITLMFNYGSALFLYVIAKERYGNKIAISATFLFLASYQIFVFGSSAMGLEIALFFFMAALYYNKKNSLLSGLLFAFCLMTRLHLLPLGIILLLNSKEKRKFLFGAGISIIYYGLLLNIPNFYEQVFGYHITKAAFSKSWLDFLRDNVQLLFLFAFSIKNIKDNFFIYMALVYLFFIAIMKSAFEYYFIIIVAILCIEGGWALVHFKHRKILWTMMAVWLVIVGLKAGYFAFSQTNDYNNFINEVSEMEGTVMGESAIATMIAVRTDKVITRNMIDLNFQRKKVFDYSDSLVVYTKPRFPGGWFNCSFVSDVNISKRVIEVWRC